MTLDQRAPTALSLLAPPALKGTWHRPLLWTAALLAALTAVLLVAVLLDPVRITNAPALLKPLKFTISIAVYCVTLSWLIGRLVRWRRALWWFGTVAAAGLLIEMVLILGAAVTGTTSHFNVSTPFATTVWAIMAFSISAVWLAAVPVVILLLRQRVGDAAFSLSLRAGFVIALIGMALAFLMTSPTAQQLADFHGIAGAHTVGVDDGGPGLPVLGWSTVAGDLRVPHFVGMHALQVLPLLALGLEMLSARVVPLRSVRVRARLIAIATVLYLGVLAVVTVQALSAESVVAPSAGTLLVSAALWLGAAVAATVVVRRGEARA
ncbi:hypothetical protein HQQ81_00020 [Microbacteriaceae bacterium VKM Ac-2854]|nr:hypothetical protein [Microbacteriaceae bacterium VKM Ac-2854]